MNIKIKKRKSKRAKHILIHVDMRGEVELVVPWHVSFNAGEKFLHERREWIERTRAKQLARRRVRRQISNAEVRQYKSQALEYLERQADAMADLLGVHIEKFSVGDYKSQWGSCNKKTKRLAFSWRLILAPAHVRRYVVAHEVAHLKYANHSQRFWATVKKLDGEFENARRWLRTHGHFLYN